MGKKQQVTDAVRSDIEELGDEALRVRMETDLLRIRKLKADLQAYTKASREVIAQVESDLEACVDQASARAEKAPSTAAKSKSKAA